MFYASDDFSYFPAVIYDLMGITIEIATYTRGGFLDDALILVNGTKNSDYWCSIVTYRALYIR